MSNLASTSRVQVRFIKETAFGVTPTVGSPNNLRLTGESLNYDLSKETSKEIRADRQLSGNTTVDATAGGDINIHMQYAEYDPFLQAMLMDVYAVYGTNGEGTSFSAAYTATTITASAAPIGSSAFTSLQLGQFFQVAHPANPNHLKVFRVSTSVAPTATVITLDAGTAAVVSAGGAGATVRTSRLTNGVTESSFTIEKQASDIGQFLAYRGQYPSKMSLKFASGSLLDGSISFMGKDATISAVTTLPGTPVASKAFDIMNAVKGVGQLWEGLAPTTNYIKTLDLNIDGNIRYQTAIATLGAVGMGVGDFAVTGSFMAYFKDQVLYNKFLTDAYTTIVVSAQDTLGNGYVFTMPRVSFTSSKIVAGAKNSDFMAEFQFAAFADDTNAVPALRKTLLIDRIGVATL
jgi:hypothetical protein